MALTKPILELPAMSEQERRDLSEEAGRELSNDQAYEFLIRKIHQALIHDMLDKTRRGTVQSNEKDIQHEKSRREDWRLI